MQRSLLDNIRFLVVECWLVRSMIPTVPMRFPLGALHLVPPCLCLPMLCCAQAFWRLSALLPRSLTDF